VSGRICKSCVVEGTAPLDSAGDPMVVDYREHTCGRAANHLPTAAPIDPACPGSPQCAEERARHAQELAEVRKQLEAAQAQHLRDAATIGALRGALDKSQVALADFGVHRYFCALERVPPHGDSCTCGFGPALEAGL
jgi:hypothetical protein